MLKYYINSIPEEDRITKM